jgi:hypothetical protein
MSRRARPRAARGGMETMAGTTDGRTDDTADGTTAENAAGMETGTGTVPGANAVVCDTASITHETAITGTVTFRIGNGED